MAKVYRRPIGPLLRGNGRTVTLASPPGVGQSVTTTCSACRLLRLEALSWQRASYDCFVGSVSMVEVIGE